jgi:hypothetical protein
MNPLEKIKHRVDTMMGESGDGLPFKKGDRVRWRNYPTLQGTIEDGWLIRKGEGMAPTEKPTLTYLIRLYDGATFRAVPSEIEPAG